MNLPKQSLDFVSAFRQKWFWMWVLLPIGAYAVGWATLYLVFISFPILLVIAQWKSLEHKRKTSVQTEGKERPKIWLYNWIVLALTGLVVADAIWKPKSYSVEVIIVFGWYYGLQTINEILLAKLFTHWRWGYWSVSNVLAALVWILILIEGKKLIGSQIKFEYFVWGVVPIMGIISNMITGLGIHLATQSRQ